MSTLQRDAISPQHGAFLRIGGFSPSMMDQYGPSITVHELEKGPNPPFQPWEVGWTLVGVAAQWAHFALGVSSTAPASGRCVVSWWETLTLDANATGIGLWCMRPNALLANPTLVRSTDASTVQSFDPAGSTELSQAVGSIVASSVVQAADVLSGFVNRPFPMQQNILRSR